MRITIVGMQAAGITGDVPANLALIRAAARQAAAGAADLLVTPEMFVTGYNLDPGELDALTTDDLVTQVAAIALETGVAILAGLPRRTAGGIRNSCVLVDATGTELGRYDKAHLFGELDRALFVAGEESPIIVTVNGVRLAMLICYDVEFPEAVRAAAVAGADVVVVPTAQMEPFAFVAEHVIRVRAWENQVYVVYVNRVGVEGSLHYVGRSSIAAPSGDVLSALPGSADEGLIVAVIDSEVTRDAKRNNPYLADRRPELY